MLSAQKTTVFLCQKCRPKGRGFKPSDIFVHKESLHSLEIAKRYREQINPIQRAWPDIDVENIKEEIMKRARKELLLRVSKGYQGIEIQAVESILEKLLQELNVTSSLLKGGGLNP